MQTDSFVTETSGQMCNGCLHLSDTSDRLSRSDLLTFYLAHCLCLEERDHTGVATEGKWHQKSRKESRKKARISVVVLRKGSEDGAQLVFPS